MQDNPFADLPRTPAAHFKLYFLASASHVIRQVIQTFGTHEGSFEQFPFLLGYSGELAGREPDDLSPREADEWWRETLRGWESGAFAHLPLRALREACGLEHEAMTLLLCVGLIEEDARFGMVFEAMQGAVGQRRPTVGLLNAWWRGAEGYDAVRANMRRLLELGLIQFVNTDAPRPEWAAQSPPTLWDVMRGEVREKLAPWASYKAPETLTGPDELIVPAELRARLALLPALFKSKEANALVVRGPERNGRRTLLGAVARALGRGVLEVRGLGQPDDERWQLLGPLATMLHALPVVVLDVPPGETVELPRPHGYEGALGVVLGKQGGVSGPGTERAITLRLAMPCRELRARHWEAGFCGRTTDELDRISERFRMTSGNIRRAARLASSYAALAGRERGVTLADVQQASRALHRQVLDTLAVHVSATGDWGCLAVSGETADELRNLENRCRYRELLHDSVGEMLGAQLNTGVRALFSGNSGTGKTLAARLLAASLQMDLYRLDLSTVVNKYIGETEKNLSQIFARAEELDVILLLDEGDALLTQRTGVSNSNDRYANLETNYLLQRLEAFEGILVVTTNAGERIDSAFQRRMDVVVSFLPPDATERWAIWQLHLPPAHRVELSLLEEVAQRCELTGGQIRNAVLHASSLALEGGGLMNSMHFEAGVRREYRKSGSVCPLRSRTLVASSSRW
jgi:hypothetical protein